MPMSPYRYKSTANANESSGKPLLVSFAAGGYTFVDNETPAGAINGTTGSDGNDDFTLTETPNPVG